MGGDEAKERQDTAAAAMLIKQCLGLLFDMVQSKQLCTKVVHSKQCVHQAPNTPTPTWHSRYE